MYVRRRTTLCRTIFREEIVEVGDDKPPDAGRLREDVRQVKKDKRRKKKRAKGFIKRLKWLGWLGMGLNGLALFHQHLLLPALPSLLSFFG